MAETPEIRFFLGANAPGGFLSFFDEFADPAGLDAAFLLKGGPGCGKSTLMRRVGRAMEERGLAVEYILCSGDPDSLDAVHIPALRAMVADATPPHVIEARCPAAAEQYVDLGRCCRPEGLRPRKAELLSLSASNRETYRRACYCLTAAAALEEDVRALLLTPELESKLTRRADGVLSREVRHAGRGAGTCVHRFLDVVSCQGVLCRYDTAEALCRKLWALCDPWGLAHPFLRRLADGAAAAGHDVILCPDPLCPQRLRHVLLPGLSLGFVTTRPGLPEPERRPFRRLRLDAMPDRERLRALRSRLRFSQKLSDSLTAEAVTLLGEVKEGHDALEALYRPHTDFSAVESAGKEVIKALLALQ